jgi:lipopolysaccharide/colanic/teichoic acid biosynthesis glycosyltransferase
MAVRAPLSQRIPADVDARYIVTKRVADIIIAGLLLIALSPLMVIVAAVVALDTPGPVLFRQRRIGEDGQPFDMLKFRSMRHNVSADTHRLAIKQYMSGQKLNTSRTTDAPYKLGNDSRITRIGKFIRKTSIDELPQLWNVIKGDMSMVGPRPPIPYEVDLYSARAMERLHGKPGLTGPWQVYGRGTVTFDEMIEMDIGYLSQRSIWYDLKLIALTAPVAILGVGGV